MSIPLDICERRSRALNVNPLHVACTNCGNCRPAATKPAAPAKLTIRPKAKPLTAAEREALELQRRRLQHRNIVLRERLRQREAVAFRAARGDVTAKLALGIFASKS